MLSSVLLTLALATGGQHLVAVSTTAMSITGDVTVTPATMTFSNGTSVSLRLAKTGAAYRLFAVSAKSNPVLLRGNTLCGAATPGYVSIGSPDAQGDVHMSFYDAAKDVCATYMYARK